LSDIASVSFLVYDHVDNWHEILEGLCRGEVGARLQDKFDVFGCEAAEILEAIVEGDQQTLLIGDSFTFEGYQIRLTFEEWPSGERDFPLELSKLLRACEVSEVKFDYISTSSG
jgi:hypothetical protein